MRDGFDRLLRDLTLVTLALGIAIGWSLIQVATGMAALVGGILYEVDAENPFLGFYGAQWIGVLAWDVGGRILSFGPLVVGLVQLSVVLAVAALVYRRSPGNPAAQNDQ
jgi:hypothetical protein